MFHPVGPQQPSVYWRRRFVLSASMVVLLALIVLTLRAVAGGQPAPKKTAAGGPRVRSAAVDATAVTRHRAAPANTIQPHSAHAAPSKASSTPATSEAGDATGTATASPSVTPSSSTPPAPCRLRQLDVAAATEQDSYPVGSTPLVSAEVTNTGDAPCVQDLADSQIVLSVYNGESRVWGSHDCEVRQGVTERTLLPGAPVLVSVRWSGMSSRPGCAGVRQRVGAGTYTLYARVSGKLGTATQFVMR